VFTYVREYLAESGQTICLIGDSHLHVLDLMNFQRILFMVLQIRSGEEPFETQNKTVATISTISKIRIFE
jgi:hypothetical protein